MKVNILTSPFLSHSNSPASVQFSLSRLVEIFPLRIVPFPASVRGR